MLKITDKKAVDTADNYKMGNFDTYARRTRLETLSLYVEHNEDNSSTPYVKQMVQNVGHQIGKLNPAEVRFEQNKSRVPHNDKPGRYAGVSALMNLLYGMFFGLFIAMYHYTSKKPVTEEMVEDAPEIDNAFDEEDTEAPNNQ